jgi:hypothetical protein
MSYSCKSLAAGVLLAGGLALAPAVYAEQSPGPDTNRPHMGAGMRHGGTMGMPGGMMEQMSEMMEGCSAMMQNRSQPPNSQFYKPSEPQQ